MMVCGEWVFFARFASFAVTSLETNNMTVVVYSAYWCPDCRVAKRFLQEHNVPFTEVDIESTPGAAEEVVARTGKRAIPQFVIDGEWVQPYRLGEGFLYDEMSERLGITQS
jgi:mycoredoxin